MKSLVGKKLQDGKYTLTQELGEGGFGRTYQAVNQILSQVVVIKTFRSSPLLETQLVDLRRQFLNEAQRLVQCYHLNIVRFYEFFIEDGVPYIVMDYIKGETLHKIVLPDKPLPEATAIKYIRQIGAALKVVHGQGLLHRDIKPQNLILRQDKQEVVLIDFGIAREFNQGMVQTHTNVVSDGYAPIEQYLPKAERTPATDIYGLAATLYTLVTAQIPIAATLRNRIALDAPKDIRPELSSQISAAIMQGVALELEERPRNVEEWLTLLPQVDADNRTQSESAKTICFIGSTNDSVNTSISYGKSPTKQNKETSLPLSANFSGVTTVTKPSYSNRILSGLIVFAAMVWGLDYVWLRFQTSAQNETSPLNRVETIPPTDSSVISVEKSQPITSDLKEQPITPSSPSTPAIPSSPVKATSEPIIKQSTPTKTAPGTPISPPQKITPKPIQKSTPPKIRRTVVSPPRKVTPKRTIRPSSKRVPSVFVSPPRKVTPKRTIRPSSKKVPSVFASPSPRKRRERR